MTVGPAREVRGIVEGLHDGDQKVVGAHVQRLVEDGPRRHGRNFGKPKGYKLLHKLDAGRHRLLMFEHPRRPGCYVIVDYYPKTSDTTSEIRTHFEKAEKLARECINIIESEESK